MNVALQQSVYDRLSVLGVTVADHIREDGPYPLIVIGEDTISEWDTDNSVGGDAVVTVHYWTRGSRGKREVKALMDQGYAQMHRAELSIAGCELVTCEWEFSDIPTEPDPAIHHGVQRFRIFFEKS